MYSPTQYFLLARYPLSGMRPVRYIPLMETPEWNVASLNQYLSSIEQGQRQHETEQLDTQTRYNEYIITGLRTMWGISTEELKKEVWRPTLEILFGTSQVLIWKMEN